MSNYYLCDTCRHCHLWHAFCEKWGERLFGCKKLVISDDQTPHEVCPYWKPKEGE